MFELEKRQKIQSEEESTREEKAEVEFVPSLSEKADSGEVHKFFVEEIEDKVRELKQGQMKEDECWNTHDEFGILSELKKLGFDESSVSDSSPYNLGSKCKSPFNHNWEDYVKNSKANASTTKPSDSNDNTPTSCLNSSTFSTYLENNPMLRYFHKKKGEDTPKMEVSTLAKPEVYLEQPREIQENPKSFIQAEKFPNAFINMNVNMNVLNPPNSHYAIPSKMHNNRVGKNQQNMKNFQNSQKIENFQILHNENFNQHNHVNFIQIPYTGGKLRHDHLGFNSNNYFNNNLNHNHLSNFHNSKQNYNSTLNNNEYMLKNNVTTNVKRNGNQSNFDNKMFRPQNTQINSNITNNKRHQSHINNNLSPNFMEMSDEDLVKHSVFLAKDQAGCRYLQKKIDDDSNLVMKIYPRLLENIVELMNDSFGNYLVQKLFPYLPNDKFFQILAIINPHLTSLGLNSHGTRVVQRLIDFLNTEELVASFIKVLRPHVVYLVKDTNGNHIILKVLTLFGEKFSKYTAFIYDVLVENVIDISTHKQGCCVLQKCLDIAQGDVKCKLIDQIIAHTLDLILDQFGNYVVQYILLLKNFDYSRKIILSLLDNICYLSKQKYSSNVVEKCFNYCDEETRGDLISALMDPNTISELILDMYGNYVIQKALLLAKPDCQQIILNTIAPLMDNMRFLPFGTKLYNKLIITYPQLSTLMFLNNPDDLQVNSNLFINPLHSIPVNNNKFPNNTRRNRGPYSKTVQYQSGRVNNNFDTNNYLLNINKFYQ